MITMKNVAAPMVDAKEMTGSILTSDSKSIIWGYFFFPNYTHPQIPCQITESESPSLGPAFMYLGKAS